MAQFDVSLESQTLFEVYVDLLMYSQSRNERVYYLGLICDELPSCSEDEKSREVLKTALLTVISIGSKVPSEMRELSKYARAILEFLRNALDPEELSFFERQLK